MKYITKRLKNIRLTFERGFLGPKVAEEILRKKRRKYYSTCHVTMRVGAIESPMFVAFQNFF